MPSTWKALKMKNNKKSEGWGANPQWRVMEAGPHNHNPLIEDVLKPLYIELSKLLKLELEELSKKVRGK
jgi:hypothetical protein